MIRVHWSLPHNAVLTGCLAMLESSNLSRSLQPENDGDVVPDSACRPVTPFTGQWADVKLEDVWEKFKDFGYDGLELACWGDRSNVDNKSSDDLNLYCARSHEPRKTQNALLLADFMSQASQAEISTTDALAKLSGEVRSVIHIYVPAGWYHFALFAELPGRPVYYEGECLYVNCFSPSVDDRKVFSSPFRTIIHAPFSPYVSIVDVSGDLPWPWRNHCAKELRAGRACVFSHAFEDFSYVWNLLTLNRADFGLVAQSAAQVQTHCDLDGSGGSYRKAGQLPRPPPVENRLN